MSSANRNSCRAPNPGGMRQVLKLLAVVCCSSIAVGLPAVSYNENPHPNSTVVFKTSNDSSNVAKNESSTVTPSASEEPASPSSLSSSSPSPPPTSTHPSSTTVSSSSSSSSSSSTVGDEPSSEKPSNGSASPQPASSSVAVEVTTVPFNSSEEFSYESNLTKSNGSLDEEFLKSVEADSVFNVTVIAGISALVVLIAVLIGVISFVLYRHLSWNRPQTLSDKFSNDESTGYIDDTAFRENSEEMYSLDNDSFLNSLEAMTIQNYWTDHVKHTKL